MAGARERRNGIEFGGDLHATSGSTLLISCVNPMMQIRYLTPIWSRNFTTTDIKSVFRALTSQAFSFQHRNSSHRLRSASSTIRLRKFKKRSVQAKYHMLFNDTDNFLEENPGVDAEQILDIMDSHVRRVQLIALFISAVRPLIYSCLQNHAKFRQAWSLELPVHVSRFSPLSGMRRCCRSEHAVRFRAECARRRAEWPDQGA